MRELELAWAAGFLDGEGSFGFQNKGRKKPVPYASAGQCDRRVLDRLHMALGVGRVYGPYTPKRLGHSEYYYWRATGYEAMQKIHESVFTYLSPVKQKQLTETRTGVLHGLENR